MKTVYGRPSSFSTWSLEGQLILERVERDAPDLKCITHPTIPLARIRLVIVVGEHSLTSHRTSSRWNTSSAGLFDQQAASKALQVAPKFRDTVMDGADTAVTAVFQPMEDMAVENDNRQNRGSAQESAVQSTVVMQVATEPEQRDGDIAQPFT